MRRLALILIACGLSIGSPAGAAPDVYPKIESERLVMHLEPGKVVKARSVQHFTPEDTVGVTAYANGRELFDVNAGGQRLDLAGRGAYVVVNVIPSGPMAIKAVALRKMRLVVLMEWSG